jgi:hypothetical protein
MLNETILLAREYAPKPSGPNPIAKIRVKKMIDIIVKMEVIAVKTISFKNGLKFILVKSKNLILKS